MTRFSARYDTAHFDNDRRATLRHCRPRAGRRLPVFHRSGRAAAKAFSAGCETCRTAAWKSSPKARPTRSSGSSAACRHGPPGARVERVDVDDMMPTGRDDRFHHQMTNMDHLKDEDPKRARLSESRHSVLRHHDAAAGPGGLSRRDRQPRDALRGTAASTWSSASKAADSSSARRSPIGSAPASRRCGSPASCRRHASRQPTISSTAPTRSRCTTMRCAKGQRVLIVDDLLATGGTARRRSISSRGSAAQVHALAFLDRAGGVERPPAARQSHRCIRF